MKINRFISNCLAASFFWLAAPAARAAAEPACPGCPNIILLMVDTLRADKLGTYGAPVKVSPEIDAYAAQGVVFEKAISQASWTRASVASLVTSRHPRDVGVLKEKWDALGEEMDTIAELLKARGYYTIGMTSNPQLNTSFGFAQGFDRYIDSTVLFPWMKVEKGKEHANGSDLTIARAADALPQLAREIAAAPADGKPRFVQVMLMDVHAHERLREIDPDLAKLPDGAYLQTIRNVSRAIGEFLKNLLSTPAWKNSVVFFTSDHGEGLNDHPGVAHSKRHGNLLYRSQIHVSLIVFGPGLKDSKAGRAARLVRLLDVLPTMCDLAGANVPALAAGVSLRPYLEGRAPAADDAPLLAIAETSWRAERARAVDKSAVTDGTWLFIENRDRWKGTNPEELQPFGAAQNGASTDQNALQPSLAAGLKAELDKWRAALAAKPQKDHGKPAKVLPQEVEQLKTLGYL